MIQEEKCSHHQKELKQKRKELKEMGYVSSVAIAGWLDNDIEIVDRRNLFADMKKIVKSNNKFHAISLDISGTTKMYYKRDEWRDIVKEANKYRQNKKDNNV